MHARRTRSLACARARKRYTHSQAHVRAGRQAGRQASLRACRCLRVRALFGALRTILLARLHARVSSQTACPLALRRHLAKATCPSMAALVPTKRWGNRFATRAVLCLPCCPDIPRSKLRSAVLEGGRAGPVKVVMCITTFKRTPQLAMALAYNLAMTWHLRELVRWVVVDFNSGDERTCVVRMLQHIAQRSFLAGQLRVFAAEPWSGWHACFAKNTSHVTGIAAFGEDVVLVNMDCDNVVSGPFVEDLLENADAMRFWRDTSCWGRGVFMGGDIRDKLPNMVGTTYRATNVSATTGRVALGGRVFRLLGGYDQEFEPMGHQDVDLSKRLRKLGQTRYIASDAAVGNAVHNHLKKVAKKERSQHERSAKVANVAPEHRGTVWEDMNARNGKMSKRKLAAGQFRRNGDNPLGLRCAEVDLTVHPAGVSAGMPSLPPSAGGRVVAIPRLVIHLHGWPPDGPNIEVGVLLGEDRHDAICGADGFEAARVEGSASP